MSDVRLEKDDVTVEEFFDECDECTLTLFGDRVGVRGGSYAVMIDFRSAGMQERLGRYCWECAEKVAGRIRDGLPAAAETTPMTPAVPPPGEEALREALRRSTAIMRDYAPMMWAEQIAANDATLAARPAPAGPTADSERAALVAEVGECCAGGDPFCSAGCLVEKALRKRQAAPVEPRPGVSEAALAFRRWLADVTYDVPTAKESFEAGWAAALAARPAVREHTPGCLKRDEHVTWHDGPCPEPPAPAATDPEAAP